MIAWHLVADLEMGITLGVLAALAWEGGLRIPVAHAMPLNAHLPTR
jgi:hypothetical protein